MLLCLPRMTILIESHFAFSNWHGKISEKICFCATNVCCSRTSPAWCHLLIVKYFLSCSCGVCLQIEWCPKASLCVYSYTFLSANAKAGGLTRNGLVGKQWLWNVNAELRLGWMTIWGTTEFWLKLIGKCITFIKFIILLNQHFEWKMDHLMFKQKEKKCRSFDLKCKMTWNTLLTQLKIQCKWKICQTFKKFWQYWWFHFYF